MKTCMCVNKCLVNKCNNFSDAHRDFSIQFSFHPRFAGFR